MPIMKRHKDDEFILAKEQADSKTVESKQESAPGLEISGGVIDHGEYDTKDWYDLIKDYTEMRNGDPVVSTTLDILKYPLMQSAYNVMPGKPTDKAKQAADFVYFTFDNLIGGFNSLKYHKLTALDFGVSLHEVIIKNNVKFEGKTVNRIVKLAPIMPETVDQWNYNPDSFELESIVHCKRRPDAGSSQITIPAEKLEFFTYNQEFDDIRGRSILRSVRLSYDSKIALLKSKVIATQRGAGIPLFETDGSLTTAEKNNLKTIARSLAQGRNTYAIVDKTKAELKLLTPQNVGDVIPMLEFLNREIYVNTMTEFLTAGIGQNGSRAATSEHKSAYELSATYILSQLEANMQLLVNRIIDLSPWANLDPDEKPIFTFSAITQTDLLKTSQMLVNVFNPTNGLLVKSQEDDSKIREILQLPNTKEEGQTGENIEENIEEVQEEQLNKCGCGNHKLSKREFNDCEWRLEKANEVLNEIKLDSEVEIDILMQKILKDVGSQLQHNLNAPIELRFKREFNQKMDKQFARAFKRGKKDVVREAEKIGVKNTIELELTPKQEKKKVTRISRAIDKLYYDINNVIEDKLEITNEATIEKAGGIQGWLLLLASQFKGDKRKILTEVDGGYIGGRSDANKELKSDIQTWFYSARLDGNLCESCAAFDGEILTTKEVYDTSSLSLSGENVNNDCFGLLGPNKCRCVLIPYGRTE